MSDRFFTSDSHYNCPRTLQYSRRPFKTVAEMNAYMVDQINKLPKGAILHHNGDFGALEYIKAIREDIAVHLVMGNWDYYYQEQSGQTLEEFRKHWLAAGFAAIYPDPLVLCVDTDTSFWMCHKPSERSNAMFNLFGHIHRASLVKRNGLNIGVDQFRFAPVALDEVLFWKEAIEKHYDSEEWME